MNEKSMIFYTIWVLVDLFYCIIMTILFNIRYIFYLVNEIPMSTSSMRVLFLHKDINRNIVNFIYDVTYNLTGKSTHINSWLPTCSYFFGKKAVWKCNYAWCSSCIFNDICQTQYYVIFLVHIVFIWSSYRGQIWMVINSYGNPKLFR